MVDEDVPYLARWRTLPGRHLEWRASVDRQVAILVRKGRIMVGVTPSGTVIGVKSEEAYHYMSEAVASMWRRYDERNGLIPKTTPPQGSLF